MFHWSIWKLAIRSEVVFSKLSFFFWLLCCRATAASVIQGLRHAPHERAAADGRKPVTDRVFQIGSCDDWGEGHAGQDWWDWWEEIFWVPKLPEKTSWRSRAWMSGGKNTSRVRSSLLLHLLVDRCSSSRSVILSHENHFWGCGTFLEWPFMLFLLVSTFQRPWWSWGYGSLTVWRTRRRWILRLCPSRGICDHLRAFVVECVFPCASSRGKLWDRRFRKHPSHLARLRAWARWRPVEGQTLRIVLGHFICFSCFLAPWHVLPVFLDLKIAADPNLPGLTEKNLPITTTAIFLGWLVGSVCLKRLMEAFNKEQLVAGFACGLVLVTLATVTLLDLTAGNLVIFTSIRFVYGILLNITGIQIVHIQELMPGRENQAWPTNTLSVLNFSSTANTKIPPSFWVILSWRLVWLQTLATVLCWSSCHGCVVVQPSAWTGDWKLSSGTVYLCLLVSLWSFQTVLISSRNRTHIQKRRWRGRQHRKRKPCCQWTR